MVDFAKLRNTARRLIQENGRSVTLVKDSRTPDDNTKPWLGGDTNDTSVTLNAAIVQYREQDIDGDRIRRGDRRAIVEVPTGNDDLRQFDRLIDRNETWGIVSINKIEPADITVVYVMQIRQ